jgi:hypothetical protein
MKGFVFIYGSEIVLRFISTGAFPDLAVKHDITYVALRSSYLLKEGGVDKQLSAELQKLEWIPFYPERFNRWSELFDISCIRYQDRSRSFQIRYQETARQDPTRTARLERLAHPEVYEEHRKAVEKDMGLHPDILALTLQMRPDFFVLPSALLDYITDDVLQIAEVLSIPTLLLMSGWDNLSSKGLIYHQPSLIGVWGEQSRRHAIEIQGAAPERVHVVGAPHYEGVYVDRAVDRVPLRVALGVPPNKTLILFAGSYRTFDETELLHEIDRAIDSAMLPPMHILYRPHPWRATRQAEANFLDQTWHHITMDPEMVDTYQSVKEGRGGGSPDNFLFRFNHLLQIYRAVDAVVSPMSTVLLEALMFGLPTMAIAFGDGKHAWSADKAAQMHHFKEFFDIPDVIVCRNRELFFSDLQKLVSRVDKGLATTLRESTQQFVYRDGRSYAERVAELVDRMLANIGSGPAYDSVKVKPGKPFPPNRLQRAWLGTRKALGKVKRVLKNWAAM